MGTDLKVAGFVDSASIAVLRATERLIPVFIDAGLGVHLVAPRPSQLRNASLDAVRRKLGITKVPALSFESQLLAEGATQVISELERIADECENEIEKKSKPKQRKQARWDGGPEGEEMGGYHEWARGRIGQPNKREDREDRRGGEAMDDNEIRNKMRAFNDRRKGRSAPPPRRRSARPPQSPRSSEDEDSEPEERRPEPRSGKRKKKSRRGLSVAPAEETGEDFLNSINRNASGMEGEDQWMTQMLFANQTTTVDA